MLLIGIPYYSEPGPGEAPEWIEINKPKGN
jgi:hypothetical protein